MLYMALSMLIPTAYLLSLLAVLCFSFVAVFSWPLDFIMAPRLAAKYAALSGLVALALGIITHYN